MEFTVTFFKLFFWSLYLVGPVLLSFGLIIVLLGQIAAYLEKWNAFDGLYWTFITATTVGYGDIRPMKKASRILSIVIALLGLIFTGIVVAVALHTTSFTLEKHTNLSTLERIKESVD